MNGDDDDDSEKSHEPSQRKLDEARKKGEVPRSNDLAATAGYGGLLLALMATGQAGVTHMGEAMMALIARSDRLAIELFDGGARVGTGTIMSAVFRAIAPWFALPALAVVLVILAQRAFVFTPSKLAPKLSRVSPMSNAKNKFGRSGLFEFAKSFAKLVIYSACLGIFLNTRLPQMTEVVWTTPMISMTILARLAIEFLAVVFIVSMTIGGLDYLWQYQEHMRKNRMSLKELKDEHKDSEGDPHMKQKRRQRGQEIATNQMMANAAGADVVIVNPTHYSVALKWSRKKGEAPICVAKGVDEIALRIREIAQENGIPIHSDPPTARALYATTELGWQIAPEHYMAVAAAIRFSEAMRKRARKW